MSNCKITHDSVSMFFPEQYVTLTLSRDTVARFFHVFFWDHLAKLGDKHPEYDGIPIHKSPGDLFNYQQIIFAQRPDFIIECGAYQGGATLYFANTLDLIGKGKVLSIDICERNGAWHNKVRNHARVTCLSGSSTDRTIVDRVYEIVGDSRNNFVILDSLHTKAHVLDEMKAYADLLGEGNYMIVEDSNLNDHPIPAEWYGEISGEGGPFEAIEEFMRRCDDFMIDTDMERRFLFSFAPSGYLKKK